MHLKSLNKNSVVELIRKILKYLRNPKKSLWLLECQGFVKKIYIKLKKSKNEKNYLHASLRARRIRVLIFLNFDFISTCFYRVNQFFLFHDRCVSNDINSLKLFYLKWGVKVIDIIRKFRTLTLFSVFSSNSRRQRKLLNILTINTVKFYYRVVSNDINNLRLKLKKRVFKVPDIIRDKEGADKTDTRTLTRVSQTISGTYRNRGVVGV